MNGEYLSYYPQFESNQVLTSAHLNEMRQYLDEQIRLTRSQLTGVGIAAGLTFEIVEPSALQRKQVEMDYNFGIRVFAGFGVSSEGYLIGIQGERKVDENPEDPYRSIRFSDYISYRVYKDESPDLYWHYWKKGKEGTPTQTPVIQLLTKRDEEQLILDGVKKETIHELTPTKVKNKVLVLYLEQKDIALRTCVGKDCDNKGSKRYITPLILLLDRPDEPFKPADPEIVRSAEIVMTGLDGLLMRKPFPQPMRVPRLILGLRANSTPLQSITEYNPIGQGYITAIAGWKTKLAKGIREAHHDYGPFLGLTDRDLDAVDTFENLTFPLDTAQYALDFLKDICRCLNEFSLLAYQLKRDTFNEGYLFARHLMLGTVPHDDTFNQFTYDKYRNYFHQFALTWDQGRRLRIAQLQFERILQLIKHFTAQPENRLGKNNVARLVPSMEDEYPVGKGAIPDYYDIDSYLPTVWDPERTLDGLHEEVLSFQPHRYSTQVHVLAPLTHDIDDYPFLRIQNLLGLNANDAQEALRDAMAIDNLPFEVVMVKLAANLSKEDLYALALRDPEFALLDSHYQSQRVVIHALVAAFRAEVLSHDISDLQKGLALPMDLKQRFIDQTPVLDNVLFALSAPTLLEFLRKDGIPTGVRGLIPPSGSDALSGLFLLMYQEVRTLAQYLVLIIEHKIALKLRKHTDACDKTGSVEDLRALEAALVMLRQFLANTEWALLQSLIGRAEARLNLLETGATLLFHNFAKVHPGIEHLGGVYKGGTYVLVYEEKRGPMLDFGDHFLDEQFLKEGTLEEIKKVEPLREEIKVFRAEFDMEALFDDDQASYEIWAHAEFDLNLENTDLKGFLIGILTNLTEEPLQPTELLGLRSSKVENLLLSYFKVLDKRGVTLNPETEAAVVQSYVKGIADAYDLAPETVQKLLPSYVSYIAPEILLLEYLKNQPKVVTIGEVGEPLPEKEIKEIPRIDIPKGELPGGPKLVTQLELEALSRILHKVLARADRDFLNPDQFELLADATPFTLWKDYLLLVEKAASDPLSPAAINKLRAQYLASLMEVELEIIEKEGIQPSTWLTYTESIAKDIDFSVEVVEEGVDAFLRFLRSQLQQFGQLSFSDKDLQLLRKADAASIFKVYLETYARSVKEWMLDLDIQRNLTQGFVKQLQAADQDQAISGGYAAQLQEYIQVLQKSLVQLAPDVWQDEKGLERLMEVLLDVLQNVADPSRLQELLGKEIKLPKVENLDSADPARLWPSFESALVQLNELIRPADITEIKELYLKTLRKAAANGEFGLALADQIDQYIAYLGAAGPDDNPYMRQELLALIEKLAGDYGIPGKALAKLQDQSVSSIWPQFLRSFMRAKLDLDGSPESPFNVNLAASIQQAFVDLLLATERKRLRELGIESQWFAYASSLMNEPLEGTDWVGRLVSVVVNTLEAQFPKAVSPAVFDGLRQVALDAVVPTFEDEFRDEEGQPLMPKGRFKLHQSIVASLEEAKIPFKHPLEIRALWQSYLDSLNNFIPLPRLYRTVVADFSLPYRVHPDMESLVVDTPTLAAPPLIATGDIAVLAPGESVDIQLLANDLQAIATLAGQIPNFGARIVNVLIPPGALGGKAFIIDNPKGPMLGKRPPILRFEALFGIPLEAGEVIEVTYELSNLDTQQTALGKVLILIRQPLGLITDPCCCCKDYTFVLTQGDSLQIFEPYLEFADRKPFVLRLLDEKGAEVDTITTPEFRATLNAKGGFISVEANDLFEGTLRLPYRVRYEGGLAVCEGLVTVLVVCDCMRMPCEITTTIKAEDGAATDLIDVLTERERKAGLSIQLKGPDGKPVGMLKHPVPRVDIIEVEEAEEKFTEHALKFQIDGTDAGSARITFLKGHWVNEEFLVAGECTLVIVIFADEQCFSFATVPADAGKVTVKTALTEKEINKGVTRLSFGAHGISANFLGKSPGVLDLQIVQIDDELGRYDAFLVTPDPNFKGEFRFDFYKGKATKEGFEAVANCNMTLEIKLDKPEEAPIVKNYSVLEDHTVIIDDLLSQEEANTGFRIRYVETQVFNEGLPEKNLIGRISFLNLIQAPDGAFSLQLIPNDRLGGTPEAAFVLQPIFGYNGPITWKYEKYHLVASEVKVVESGTIVVDVLPAVDCEVVLKARPAQDVIYENALSGKELENGYELRFFSGQGFTIDALEKIEGVELLSLLRDTQERLTQWIFRSQPEALGEIRFRVAAGRMENYAFVATRICTIKITVEPAEVPPTVDLVPLAWGYSAYGQTDVPANLDGSVAVAAGTNFSIALKNDGSVVTWGAGFNELLAPKEMPLVTAIAAGDSHAMALTQFGTVIVWGRQEGQWDNPIGLFGVLAIAAGGFHCVALKTDGTVVAWGDNKFGQCDVPPLTEVRGIAAGLHHTLALNSDGTVIAWGLNDLGQCDVPKNLSGIVAIAAGYWHSLALTDEGTMVGWGRNYQGQCVPPPDLGKITALAGGASYTMALRENGTVAVWGENGHGECDVPPYLSGVEAIAAGSEHIVVLAPDFDPKVAVAWGLNQSGQTDIPIEFDDIQSVEANGAYTVVVKTDGSVATFGFNGYGPWDLPTNINNVKAMRVGAEHTVALTNDGKVFAWGQNNAGQLDVPSDLTGVKNVGVGAYHNVALKYDGTLVAWGDNKFNQCDIPKGLTDVKSIRVAPYHTLALKKDGTVVAWGLNDDGQCKVPARLGNVKAIAVGRWRSAAIRMNGTIALWGMDAQGESTVPNGLKDVKAITLRGAHHTLAILNNGQVVAWGYNADGQCNVPEKLANVVAIAAGDHHSLALTAEGNVFAWGNNTQGQCLVPKNARNVTQIAAGDYHSVALIPSYLYGGGEPNVVDKIAVAWGRNYEEELKVPEGLQDINTVSTSGYHTLALRNDRTVAAWGYNYYGQCDVSEKATDVRLVLAAQYHSLALRNDGTVLGWGYNYYGQCNAPSDLTNVKAIASRYSHSLALKDDGTIVAWGDNSYGQSTVPRDLIGVKAIAAGYYHSLALKDDGTVVAWGYNYFGQCDVPSDLREVREIVCGDYLNVAIKNDGSVVVWGYKSDGQDVVPPDLADVVAVSTMGYHVLALQRDGKVVAWGNNAYGQCNVPEKVIGVVQITSGYYHSVALRDDGTVIAWGYNSEGEIDVPENVRDVTEIQAGFYHTVALIPLASIKT